MASNIECGEIVSTLNQIHRRGHSAGKLFRDWLDLMLFALQRRDDPYLEVVDKYSDDRDMNHPEGERTIDLFSKAFGQLQNQMAETNADVLGAVYEEYGMQTDAWGQHFTPLPVCDMKAELAGVENLSEAKEQPTVAGPACGSGRLLIVAARQCPNGVFVGRDVDGLCARMAALNLCFFNIDGFAILGDSLKMEFRRVWRTTGSALGGSVRELEGEDLERFEQKYRGAFDAEASPEPDTDQTEPEAVGQQPPAADASDQPVVADGDPQARETRLETVHEQVSLGDFGTDS